MPESTAIQDRRVSKAKIRLLETNVLKRFNSISNRYYIPSLLAINLYKIILVPNPTRRSINTGQELPLKRAKLSILLSLILFCAVKLIMKILIADDEIELAEVLRDCIIEDGLFNAEDISLAENGQIALNLCEKEIYSIVVTDLKMPKVDGTTLIKTLAAKNYPAEYVVFTGHANVDAIAGLFPLGVREFIRKPFSLNTVIANLRTIKDRIDIRKVNDDLKKRLIDAEKFSTIGLLAAGIAHEINNPNTFVKGNLELLLKYSTLIIPNVDITKESDPQKKQILEMASNNLIATIESALKGSERIKKIVSSLLTIGRQGSEQQQHSIKSMVDSAIELTQHRTKMHKLVVNIPDELPEITCNSQDIQHVVMNLIINSVDAIEEFNKDHTGVITVSASLDSDKKGLTLSVADNGPGISDSVLSKIFNPFYTTKPAGKGTGLGLSIAKSNAEKSGATLRYEKSPEGGASFVMNFKLKNKMENAA